MEPQRNPGALGVPRGEGTGWPVLFDCLWLLIRRAYTALILATMVARTALIHPGLFFFGAFLVYFWGFLKATLYLLLDAVLLSRPRLWYGWEEPVVVRPPTWNDWVMDSWMLLLALLFIFLVVAWIFVRIQKAKPQPVNNTVVWGGFQCERMMDGSSFVPSKMPNFMFTIEGKVDGEWQRLGVGYRSEFGLTTAAHVIYGVDDVRLCNGAGISVEVASSGFVPVQHLDLVRMLYENDVTVLCLKQANESKTCLMEGSSQMVMVHNGSISSMGALKAMNFGTVEYSGSTSKGFSGSPYFFGNTVFGMHLASTNVNFGFDVDYMRLVSRKEESSEEFMLKHIRKGNKYDWELNPSDPDEVYAKVGGRYVILDRYQFYQAKEEADEERARRTVHYDEMETDYNPAIRMALDDMMGTGKKRRAGRRVLRPVQLEGGLDLDESPTEGNGNGPVVPVMGAAGRLSVAEVLAEMQSTQTTGATEPKLVKSTSSTEPQGSIPAPKSLASPTMSGATHASRILNAEQELELINARMTVLSKEQEALSEKRKSLRSKVKKR